MLYDLNGSSDEDEDADFHSHDDQQKPASHVGQQKPASRAEPGTSSNQLIDLVSDDDDNADIARRLQAEEDKSDAGKNMLEFLHVVRHCSNPAGPQTLTYLPFSPLAD